MESIDFTLGKDSHDINCRQLNIEMAGVEFTIITANKPATCRFDRSLN